ncbi:hypothetical protein CEE36_01105 [candidate division TA06 bacterium B3_TA06]|uniref:Uncharacterized protein n=1 Tax=candidate division TA06 bacterium B3_TA06 TaxID=2012487 RepID=A0A532VAY7_UNCT6|nr:MAG: hypothetical protein CEE36_01105 [candidate division TA06 bacterium B3_TA06]
MSAIVQALAALLAIIFAGVAILWGQESQSLNRLESLRSKYIELLQNPHPKKKEPFIETIRKLLFKEFSGKGNLTPRHDLSIAHKLNESPLETLEKVYILSKALFVKPSESGGIIIDRTHLELQEVAENLGLSYRPIKIPGRYESLGWFSTDKLFFLLRNVNAYITFEHLKNPLTADGIEQLLRTIDRARRARGPWFKALISLYAVTVAVGMVFLSVLKKGTWDIQATWIASVPLFLAICAVALTFYYLARIVSGEKDA